MEALRKKFKSRRGASILLALLLMLVCMMVAASVMMAAASNVGKIRSNKEEQQKYLTLSSAMTMMIDELKSVSYVGQYEYEKVPVYMDQDEKPLVDADGNPSVDEDGKPLDEDGKPLEDEENVEIRRDKDGKPVVHHYIHTYNQLTGELTGGAWLDTVLPLLNDLDYIFAGNFKVPEEEKESDGPYFCYHLPNDKDSTTLTTPEDFYTLEFTVNDDEGQYGGLSEDKVRIKVTLRTDGSILLVADLWEKGEDASGNDTWSPAEYTMEALLRPDPDDWPEKRLVLKDSPTIDADGLCRTEPIRWKLEYVFKKGAEPNASESPEAG